MSRPHRVLFLTGKLHGGGSENVLLRHVLSLDRARFTAEILAFDQAFERSQAYRDAGVEVTAPPRHRSGLVNVLRFRRALAERCASGQVSLVHAWIALTAVVGPHAVRRASAVPVVASQRNLGYWLDPLQRRLYRWSNRRYIEKMVVNSQAVRQRMIAERLCPADRIRVVVNGVDLERFAPRPAGAARAALGLDPGLVTIGMVGTLKPIKGQQDLLGALPALAAAGLSFQVVLVGEGPDRAALERSVEGVAWRSRVHFLGQREDVEALYPAFDVVVLASRTEGFPNVVLEAMASGCAMVVTPVGGVPEAVEDGVEGIHYRPGDVDGLARALRSLLTDPELRRRMGSAARLRCTRQFGWDAMQHALQDIYLEVLEGRPGAVAS